jgi:hypothetical protein
MLNILFPLESLNILLETIPSINLDFIPNTEINRNFWQKFFKLSKGLES